MKGTRAYWLQWGQSRAAELQNGGVQGGAAYRFATGEAKARSRIERLVGRRIAEQIELDYIEDDRGGTRFVLVGGIAGVREDRLAKLESLPGVRFAMFP